MLIQDPGWKKFGSAVQDAKKFDPGWKKFGSEIRNGKNSDPGSGINIPDPQNSKLVVVKSHISYETVATVAGASV
jgi:hypothetical protein